MNNNKLLVYDFNELYKILSEIKDKINFEVSNITEADIEKIGINKDYLILTKKKINHIQNQFIINDFPISVHKLLEKLNISFLKLKYSEQSQIKVGAYIIDLNSREMILENLKIKLTEKETNIIIFIYNSTKPMNVSDLQTKSISILQILRLPVLDHQVCQLIWTHSLQYGIVLVSRVL